jgi:hypothetical protein
MSRFLRCPFGRCERAGRRRRQPVLHLRLDRAIAGTDQDGRRRSRLGARVVADRPRREKQATKRPACHVGHVRLERGDPPLSHKRFFRNTMTYGRTF